MLKQKLSNRARSPQVRPADQPDRLVALLHRYASFMDSKPPILNLSRHHAVHKRLFDDGREVVYLSGCFDLFGVRHVEILRRTSQNYPRAALVVGIWDDEVRWSDLSKRVITDTSIDFPARDKRDANF